MLKPIEIRELLTRSVPQLHKNPDKLLVFMDDGHIACRGTNSLSYQYHYQLNILLTDFAGHADLIILPLLVYLRTNAPELFENYTKNPSVIRFEIDILNNETIDLTIQMDLTERVRVEEDSRGKLVATHLPEPEHPELPNHDYLIEVWSRPEGEQLGTISVPKWLPKF
ncbi:hypothetical protein AAEX37_01020 [Oligella sp. MSHR50489EDL]|uniref:phage tail protein n=1 Tax=Oligella sp. MSHR50489EDL TaxID=3139409 RepID=UPI003D816C5D